MKFYALEPHVDGTKKYERGDEREVDDENDVKHLVDLKVLSTKAPPKAKAEAGADKNKSEGAADENKSA